MGMVLLYSVYLVLCAAALAREVPLGRLVWLTVPLGLLL
jgi:hypothetical protein